MRDRDCGAVVIYPLPPPAGPSTAGEAPPEPTEMAPAPESPAEMRAATPMPIPPAAASHQQVEQEQIRMPEKKVEYQQRKKQT